MGEGRGEMLAVGVGVRVGVTSGLAVGVGIGVAGVGVGIGACVEVCRLHWQSKKVAAIRTPAVAHRCADDRAS